MGQRRRRNDGLGDLRRAIGDEQAERSKSTNEYRHLFTVVIGGDVAIFHGSVTIVL
jgi:hypothetical protein